MRSGKEAAEALGISEEAFAAADVAHNSAAEATDDPAEAAAMEGKEAPQEGAEEAQEGAAPGKGKEAPARAEEPPKPNPSQAKAWEVIKSQEQRTRKLVDAAERDRKEARRMLEEAKAESDRHAKSRSDIVSGLRSAPLETLERLGIPVQGLLDTIIKGAPAPGSAQTPTENTELSELRKELASVKEMLQKRDESQSAQAAESRVREVAQKTLAGQEYELLRAHPDPVGQVIGFLGAYYQEHGRPALQDLTMPDILGMLQDTYRDELTKLSSSQAVRKVLGLSDTPPAAEDEGEEGEESRHEPQQPVRRKPRTVTPSMTSSPAAGSSKPPPRPSEEETLRKLAATIPADVWEHVD